MGGGRIQAAAEFEASEAALLEFLSAKPADKPLIAAFAGGTGRVVAIKRKGQSTNLGGSGSNLLGRATNCLKLHDKIKPLRARRPIRPD